MLAVCLAEGLQFASPLPAKLRGNRNVLKKYDPFLFHQKQKLCHSAQSNQTPLSELLVHRCLNLLVCFYFVNMLKHLNHTTDVSGETNRILLFTKMVEGSSVCDPKCYQICTRVSGHAPKITLQPLQLADQYQKLPKSHFRSGLKIPEWCLTCWPPAMSSVFPKNLLNYLKIPLFPTSVAALYIPLELSRMTFHSILLNYS